ncbi:MAG TPA: prepilin-type N-terminal cleavage/methylation domain-containing protein [Coleofasciculaceae cyanobacterium]|jgi:prepilin-type N-terminal cleavage/methylation domain-containing protein
MKIIRLGKGRSTGYNLIELAMVIAVVATLAAFALISFGNTGEQRDAQMVMSAQASLQSIVSQGAVRMDRRPDQLPAAAVLMAVQSAVSQNGAANNGVSFTGNGNQFTMTISSSNRAATFEISNTGDVRLIGLNNFANYTVDTTHAIWTIKKI